MLNIKAQPDFSRFLDTLLLRKAWRRPPLFDFHIDPSHKRRLLGRELRTAADEVEFFRRAGYDYVQCTVHAFVRELQEVAQKEHQAGAASHGSDLNLITDLRQFRSRRWSWQDAADGDVSAFEPAFQRLEELVEGLPGEMKILLHNADVFTYAWELIGFTNFCLKTYEEPELIAALMDSLAQAQLNVTRRAARIAGKALGVIFYSDDIAYTEGLMLSPEFFVERLFPVIGRFVGLGREHGAPLIYHTDGRLYQVFDELAGLGVRGIQPLEPKSMDPLEIQRRWPGCFCLIGNIDLDLMARGTPDQVEIHVRDRIDRLNRRGGYMPGVSNTVPDYVKFENYLRMIQTVYSYPDERIA